MHDSIVLLGLPRGGVVVAAAAAQVLRRTRDVTVDVVLVRKVGVPAQPELAMGAIGEGGIRVVNDDVMSMCGIATATFDEVARAEQRELERRAEAYRGGHPMSVLDGRLVVMVDDGIATGATARAALGVVRALRPAVLMMAAPVAAAGTVRSLASLADVMVIDDERDDHDLSAVGASYRRFDQTTDAEVISLLRAER
ncbi:MAG: phosphoribosyltransferase family protein [Ilumatobacteraceae bacterium]